MKGFQSSLLAAASLVSAAIFAPLSAAPAGAATPSVAINRVEAQRTCHHYRWSSQRRCTSANVLKFYNPRPRLHYPSRYYGGTPHYAYAHPYWYYGYRPFYYGAYGFHRYPWYRRPYWY